ncbi:epoxide hydrolase family protein [Spirosoma validum]|uniref:Epoxide hydrolase n=1 Tax=Spirosoma validum TaxID=2771355 RepID=A0A927GGA1_9BACT|nr:epoxide hydrolase family protein [Spirosoma validum]MBD2756656.1 epoxide hydrolase [Spirosoma validum]
MVNAKTFHINVPQSVLDDLKERLADTRWPDEPEDANWEYGTNREYLKELANYWQNQFDWRKQEAMLNQFTHYKAMVDGLNIHFIYEKGKGPNPIPLVLTHGWPDSFFRMYKIIPMLTDPARFGKNPADSFDVIVLSFPGFGFSDKPTKPGFNLGRVAEHWHKLMTENLGYHRYAAAGGDGGAAVSELLGQKYPDALTGVHMTDVGFQASLNADPKTLSDAEKQYMEQMQQMGMQEGAYAMVQGTKPQSLAYGLNDSPVGLAAWIIEKFRTWSDCNGDLESVYTKDELLTNIMLYWVTDSIGSAIRGYYEETHTPSYQPGGRVEVPVGMAIFPKDNPPPREFAERSLNIQRWSKMPHGGHFAALEEPETLADELRDFFRPLRSR